MDIEGLLLAIFNGDLEYLLGIQFPEWLADIEDIIQLFFSGMMTPNWQQILVKEIFSRIFRLENDQFRSAILDEISNLLHNISNQSIMLIARSLFYVEEKDFVIDAIIYIHNPLLFKYVATMFVSYQNMETSMDVVGILMEKIAGEDSGNSTIQLESIEGVLYEDESTQEMIEMARFCWDKWCKKWQRIFSENWVFRDYLISPMNFEYMAAIIDKLRPSAGADVTQEWVNMITHFTKRNLFKIVSEIYEMMSCEESKELYLNTVVDTLLSMNLLEDKPQILRAYSETFTLNMVNLEQHFRIFDYWTKSSLFKHIHKRFIPNIQAIMKRETKNSPLISGKKRQFIETYENHRENAEKRARQFI